MTPGHEPMQLAKETTAQTSPNPQEEVDVIASIVQGVRPEELTEDRLEDLIDLHPDVIESTSRLTEIRKSKEHTYQQEKQEVENIKAQRAKVGNEIKIKLGIVEESPEETEKRLEIERRRKLGSILISLTGQETDDELLAKYGFINEQGKMTRETMQSPLFRNETQRAFNKYMDYVRQFENFQEAELQQGGVPMRNTVGANALRGEAHDVVARLVGNDLGLSFEDARRFVAKSRDAIIPGQHEKDSYAYLLRGQKLAERFGHDALDFTRESLKSLIDEPMDHEK